MPHLSQEGARGDLQGLPPVPDDQLDRRDGLAPAGQPRQPGTAGNEPSQSLKFQNHGEGPYYTS